MARKECSTVVIETSSHMLMRPKGEDTPTFLNLAFDCLTSLCHQKLLFAPKSHEVGLIKFGEKAELSRDYGPVTVEFVRELERIENESNTDHKNGDPLAAISDAMYSYKKAFPKKGPSHRIFLFTSLEGETTYDQTSAVQLAHSMRDSAVRVNLILCRTPQQDKAPTGAYLMNKGLVDVVLGATQSATVDINDAVELYRKMQTKTHHMVTKYKGVLTVNSDLKIGVCSYTKCTQENLDNLKKFSKIAEKDDGKVGSAQVKRMSSYYEHDDPTMRTIAPDQIIKAFYYGRQVVPIPNQVREEMKVVDDKQITLLGFTEAKNVPRQFLLTGVDIIVPLPSDTNITGFNSLVDSMLETDKVGIVRYIMRNNNPPKIAAIFAHKTSAGFRCLYISQLPTAEDIRDYRFAKLPESNEDENNLVEQLVDKMDLMSFRRDESSDPVEALRLSEIHNPIQRRLETNLLHRAVTGSTQILPVPAEDMEAMTPDTITHQQAEGIVHQIRDMFGLQEHDIQRITARARVFWLQLLSTQREQDRVREGQVDLQNAQKLKPGIGGDKSDGDYLKNISMIHPVSDFNEMRKNKKVDLIESAMSQLAGVIDRHIQESIRGSYYEKAIECLAELRKGCLEEDEPIFFNTYLRRLRDSHREGAHRNFWRLIVRRGLTLISSAENRTSDVSEEDSIRFLEDEENTFGGGMDLEIVDNEELDDIE